MTNPPHSDLMTSALLSSTSQRSSVLDTPLRRSSNTYNEGSDATRLQIDPFLKAELKSCFKEECEQFFDGYFAEFRSAADAVQQELLRLSGSSSLFGGDAAPYPFPIPPTEPLVIQWLGDVVTALLDVCIQLDKPPATTKLFSSPNKPLDGNGPPRKLDVGFRLPIRAQEQEQRASWQHTIIPGELKKQPEEDAKSLTVESLARSFREIFRQSRRSLRFLHGFSICGSVMRLYLADRAGGFKSSSFDFTDEENECQFIIVIYAYLHMNETKLGFDPSVQMQEDGQQVLTTSLDGDEVSFTLQKPLFHSDAIHGRGTFCWPATRRAPGSMEDVIIIKDGWYPVNRLAEGELLKEASVAGVTNIAQYCHHEVVSVGNVPDRVYANVRKGLVDKEQSRPDHPAIAENLLPWSEDREHRRVFLRPCGTPIRYARTPVDLLKAVADGIRGHSSLLAQANILHRDISMNNIMIHYNGDKFEKGFLIDLDLAIRSDRATASGAPSRTGTPLFMAIDVLSQQEDQTSSHSQIHDLESFFWVLWWIVTNYGAEGKRERDEASYRKIYPRDWNWMSFEELSAVKAALVGSGRRFPGKIEAAVTQYYSSIVSAMTEFRDLVFPGGEYGLKDDESGVATKLEQMLREEARELEGRIV